MVAGADRPQLLVGVAQHVRDPVALRVQGRAQPPRGLRRGQHDVEVRAPDPSVADPLHVAAVGVEGHRPADAVDQRLRVAVVVVRARDALVVVRDPRDRRVVRAEGRAREQQPEPGARERVDGRAPPGRVLAHVVRLVGDQQRRALRAAALVHRGARGHGRVRDRHAVPVTRLGPGRVGPVGLELDAVARGVERPLAADVGRRRHDGDARDAPLGQHPVGDVQAEGGLAGRGRGRRQEGVAGVGEDLGRGGLLPRAQGTTAWARTAGSDPPWGGEEHRSRTSREEATYAAARTAHMLVVRSMIVSLHVTHFSDPGCPWAWSASPALAALKWRYGDQLDWRNVMIGLTENGAVYEQRGYTGPGQARGYRTLPRARDAVRHRAAREGPRHVADVPRGRRHPPAGPRARVRGLPRAAVRPVHHDRLPRGRRAAAQRRSSGCPASTPRRSSRRPRTRRPRRPSCATATRPAPRPARRPSSRTSTPTPTAACATPRRA